MKFTSIYGICTCSNISVSCRNSNCFIGETLILLINEAKISIAKGHLKAKLNTRKKKKKLPIKLKCGVTAHHILLLWHLLFSKGKVPLSDALTGREVTCYLHFSALLLLEFMSVEKLNLMMENISWGRTLWGTVGVSYKSNNAPLSQSHQKNRKKKCDDKTAVNHCNQLFDLIGMTLLF